LSSDKTNISAQTGGRVAHPLLISSANISMDFRTKASNHAFLLVALIPVPTFIHPDTKIQGILEARLYHSCLDLILSPLKTAAQLGVMLTDPVGFSRYCFTPLVSCIVDTPESALIAGVGGRTSSVTLAFHSEFGDSFRHPPRLARNTLTSIAEVEKSVHPWDLVDYEKKSREYRLNGVHRPFWRDWALSEPSIFLTPEPLHHWHKQFWDHDAKWCIYAVGDVEINFRFSVLQPRSGYRYFRQGISKLKQVTGREHRDCQRYIVSIIADAVSPNFTLAIRALMDFRYLSQANLLSDDDCRKIVASLDLFHSHKQAILDADARRGKNGPLDNWNIPKLEFLQSVVPHIKYNGVPIQWSADYTEHAHVEVIKDPASSGNNQAYEAQICRYLDRVEKIADFHLATAIRTAGIDFRNKSYEKFDEEEMEDKSDDEDDEFRVSSTADLLAQLQTSSDFKIGPKRVTRNLFHLASLIQQGFSTASSLVPLRTLQCTVNVAFHLNRIPSLRRKLIDDVATTFGVNDFGPAITDFICRLRNRPDEDRDSGHISLVGGRRIAAAGIRSLSVQHVEVWSKMRLQTKAYHYPHVILPASTINAAPPSKEWPNGRFDPVVVNVDASKRWPQSGLSGEL
jgi:hypothetical protein